MRVVDSSGWIEYLTDGPHAAFFAPAIERPSTLIIPALSLFEVFRWSLRNSSENAALEAVALMQQSRVVELSAPLSLSAASLSHKHKLPRADSIIYATAQAFDAELWTQDADFAGLPKVRMPI